MTGNDVVGRKLWLRALLICDDVRIEHGGTVSAIGVRSDRIQVIAEEGPIVIARLTVLTIVAGLLGEEQIAWRYDLAAHGSEPDAPASMQVHAHDPSSNEHYLVNVLSPVEFAGEGGYRLTMEIEAAGQRVSHVFPFVIERSAAAPPV